MPAEQEQKDKTAQYVRIAVQLNLVLFLLIILGVGVLIFIQYRKGVMVKNYYTELQQLQREQRERGAAVEAGLPKGTEALDPLSKEFAYKSVFAYEQALKKNPDDVKIVLGLAVSYLNIGRLNDAINECNKILRRDKDNLLALIVLNQAYLKKKDADNIIATGERIRQLSPGYKDIRRILAGAYLQKKEFAKARKEFGEILKTDPDYAPAYLGLGQIYADEGSLKEALDSYEKLAILQPSLAAVLNTALVQERIGLKDNAVQNYTLISDTSNILAQACNNLANLYLSENPPRILDAEELIRIALAVDSKNVAYLDTRGWISYLKQDYEDAIKYLYEAKMSYYLPGQQISELQRSFISYHLGVAYYKAGQYEKAESELLGVYTSKLPEKYKKAAEAILGQITKK